MSNSPKDTEEALATLLVQYMAEYTLVEMQTQFFGPLPEGLADKCEEIINNFQANELNSSDRISIPDAIDLWKKHVIPPCKKIAQEARAEYLARRGLQDAPEGGFVSLEKETLN